MGDIGRGLRISRMFAVEDRQSWSWSWSLWGRSVPFILDGMDVRGKL